jgi:hypothetical protein
MAGLDPAIHDEKKRPGAIPAFLFFRVVAVHHAVIFRYAVIVREGGRSSTPRLFGSITDASDYGMPAFAGMTG